jgi:phage baseplate assembly protein gpV
VLLETERRRALARAFRIGIVNERDAANARVRVQFAERDQLTSWWLPIVVFKSQDDKGYWMPDEGEMVVCLMDENDEAGAVLGAIYSSVDTPPVSSADKFHLSFRDGASFEYDRAAHLLDVKMPDGGEIRYDAGAHRLTLTSHGDIALRTDKYDTTLGAIIDTYNAHTHGGVQPGSGNTSSPNQGIS